jgi:DNA processing protein
VSREDLIDRIRLSLVDGVGPRVYQVLVEHFSTPGAVLKSTPEQLCCVRGIGPTLAGRIARATADIDAEAELLLAQQQGLDVLTEEDCEFPRLLREIADPPAVLYRHGTAAATDGLAVAIVGTRHATQYGLKQAERLAFGLAQVGLTVVSGLARGIDAAAHRGALAGGGRSIAVLGGGVLNIYPPEHVDLSKKVISQGYLLSEAPPRRAPFAGAFPQRNRLISGLTLGTVVVEAPLRSGALITARTAYEQGREVFAVPGPVDNPTSHGSHALIKDGAILVESVKDILAGLGPLVEGVTTSEGTTVRHPAELQLAEVEQQVLHAIETSPTSIDAVTQTCGLPVHNVLATISALEVRQLIRRVSGNQVVRL